MAGVGGIAGQSLQDNLFKGEWNEAPFQKDMVARLRSRPSIGSALEEHPYASGGITDLSFLGVRLELKAISDHPVTRADVENHLPQTVQYVTGSDKRFGILCILDTHPKTAASGSVADRGGSVCLNRFPRCLGGDSVSVRLPLVLAGG
jgi:hypothetical protein